MNQSEEAGSNEPNRTEVLFVGFNQDGTSLAIGTRKGYKLYSIASVEKLELIYENTTEKDVCIVERLFSSSLVAIVSLNAHRMLKVCHFKKGTEICNYSYSNTILAVRLNRLRLLVCLEESLYIHNIRNMEVLHTIRDTPPNPKGLCCLVPKDENCYLAYPGSSTIGEVQIFDASNLRAAAMINAHDSPLASMAFDANGTKLATASTKGTVIRVFSVPSGDKLFELRRGMKRCVDMYSLSFSPDALLLSSSSNTETVHVFKLEQGEKPPEQNQSWMNYLGKAIMNAATYLPAQVSDVVNQGRSFAVVRHPFSGVRNICMIANLQKTPRLLVASADGYLYIYAIDPNEGGDCTLLKQHKLEKMSNPATAGDGAVPRPSSPITYAAAAAKQPEKSMPVGSLGSDRGAPDSDSPPPVQRPEA
ncbi:WD repeat domain phosphoinositide-interacting protein 2-like [Paramacrobiotus metropolitanus]|uniref:WD repeat domain phosphoinositide-interacting protein 2-like n=1 Tax=Paramacrobiotus metropolitanus TaxID=2943436 RepID=UPI002445E750|nr:WD repeat domain phosphoinositide-interacting protein 2-like [Paramacrobiotus metropolitanus]XP_055328387.1 WD repeat domain phosphoinositide-interacting protein 2-like [Paramacrobiotus metropolitanus]